ncbi:MAG TPA: hypothetical protein VE170_16010 [Candidatus Limnocylindria bacterium]|nr:hypothetical protein [Candidatus Limnocylindria bacterium]
MRGALRILAILITLVFPLALWLGEGRVAPAWLAALLLLGGLARLPATAPTGATRYWTGATILLALSTFWSGALLPLRFYPVLVSGAFLTVFAYSLVVPPSTIERLARLHEPGLSPAAVAYTRRVTQVWCVFFALNGAIALYTALFGSMAQWSFYNGFLAYLLMGIIFAGEYCARYYFKRRHGSSAQSA